MDTKKITAAINSKNLTDPGSIVEEFISSMDTSMVENEIVRKSKNTARRKVAIKKRNKKGTKKFTKLSKQTATYKKHGHKDHDLKYKGHVCQTPMANNTYREKRWATWATGSSRESLSAYIIYQMM